MTRNLLGGVGSDTLYRHGRTQASTGMNTVRVLVRGPHITPIFKAHANQIGEEKH